MPATATAVVAFNPDDVPTTPEGEIGRRIRRLRGEKIHQRELAFSAEITRAKLSKIESGCDGDISKEIGILKKIAEELGCTIEYLLTGK
jgi:transcriptional regulator with XRE-family HTH domain